MHSSSIVCERVDELARDASWVMKSETHSDARSFPIVGVGASAGGLEALEALLGAMPVEPGIAIVVVVHLDPTHVSLLPELLEKRTQLPVVQILDGMIVEPNRVYVIPPNKDLAIAHGRLSLTELTPVRSLRIDSFFRSLAEDQGRNAVCIVLSGTGTDGTIGARAIKGAVGMVMVQDEESAKYGGMPRSAIETGLVDYILSPEQMPSQLIKYVRHANQTMTPRIVPPKGPVPQALAKIFALLRARTEHDFSLYKKNTICRRIERRMNVHQLDDIDDYVRYLEDSEREADVLFKELLIGVTNFFRDPDAFAVLQNEVVPKMLAAKPDDHVVRVWVAGCASGEEAYSIAIVLHETMASVGRHFHVQVFGTDLDAAAIDVARAGVYPASIASDLGPERLERYFDKLEGGQYRVKNVIREMLVFATQNVIRDPAFTKLDLLCCRNLLIYLGPELQQRLLPAFHYSLLPTGVLFLGSSETVGTCSELFVAHDKTWKIYGRKAGASIHPHLKFPVAQTVSGTRNLPDPETVYKAETLSALRLVETILHQSEMPPCAIINDASDLIYIHGRTGRFLEPAEGRVSVNVVEMARPGLRKHLVSAIRQVGVERKPVVMSGLRVGHDGMTTFLDLTVKPLLEPLAIRGLLMVVFREIPDPSDSRPSNESPHETRLSRTAEDLEYELLHTREDLQTTIEELETSNEEHRSANEELQSTNEELQSTNEELETSKEELQSLNEESITVNAELQARIDELSTINDDMKNLLDSTEIATIFLDNELRVRRFTPKATELIPLKATDAGRPIGHLASVLLDTDLAEYGEMVLRDLAVREAELASRTGTLYLMRVRPYRTIANVIDGVVLTFEDITQRRRDQEALRESEQRHRLLFELASDSIVVVDAETGAITDSNLRASERTGHTPEEFADLTLHDISGAESAAAIAQHIETALAQGSHEFQTKHKTKGGVVFDVLVRTKVVTLGGKKFLLSTWNDHSPDAGGPPHDD